MRTVKAARRTLVLVSLLAAVTVMSSGCIVAPAPGYGYGLGPVYAAPPVVVAPAPVYVWGWGWGGHYGHRWR